MVEHSFMEEYVRPPQAPSPRGFSLAALFLLLTTAGVVAALARNASLNTDWQLNNFSILVLGHAVLGVVFGGIVGFFVGISYPRPMKGGAIGATAGSLSGGISASIAAAGASLWIFVVGAIALVSLGVLVRWTRREE